MPNKTTVREYLSRPNRTSGGKVLAMPSPQGGETTTKKATDRRTITMPALIATAGYRFLRYGGDIERFRVAEGMTRRQAFEMVLACVCADLYGPRRAA